MTDLWFIVHLFGALASIFLLYVVLKLKNNNYSYLLVLTTICATLSIIARCFYITQTSEDGLLLAAKMEYLGKCYANCCSLLFVMRFLNLKYPKYLFNALFFLNTIACILILTTEHHFLYYSTIATMQSPVGIVLNTGKTPIYYAYMLFIIGQMIAYLCITGISWYRHKQEDNNSTAYFLLFTSAFCPLLLLTGQLTGIIKNIDCVPLGIIVSIILLVLAIRKYELLDLIQDAKNYIIENLEQGIVIVDNNLDIIYTNPWTERVLTDPKILDNLSVDRVTYALENPGNAIITHNDRTLEVCISPLKTRTRTNGYLILLMDITEISRQAQQMKMLKEKAEAANKAKSTFISNLSHEIRTPMNAIIGMTEILLRDTYTAQQTEYLHNIQTSGNSLLGIINDILDYSKMESGKFDMVQDVYEPFNAFRDLGMMFLNRIGDKDIELLVEMDPRLPRTLYGDSLRVRQLIINIVNNAIKYTERGFIHFSMMIDAITDQMVVLKVTTTDTGKGIKPEDQKQLFDAFQRVDVKKNAAIEGTGLGLSITKQLVELMGGTISVSSEYGKGSTFTFTIQQGLIPTEQRTAATLNAAVSHARISGEFSKPELLEHLIRLIKMHTLTYVPYEDLNDSNQVDFFFTDRTELEQIKSELSSNTKICYLYNPLKEIAKGDEYICVPKPLCNSSFCNALNNQKSETQTASAKRFDFSAPNAHVLIVDDMDMNLRVATGLLKPLEIQIDTAKSGAIALEKLQHTHYDLIFMDHMMPEMDGIETTKKIREMDDPYYKKVPIIALTANAVQGAKEEFLRGGMNDFVAKPIAINDIVQKLQYWLPKDLLT